MWSTPRWLLVVALAGLECACAATGVVPGAGDISSETVVASVNGEPIVVAELLIGASHERAGVIADFSARHGARVDDRFWTTRFGGERPIDILKRRALELAVKRKLEQLLMKDHAVLQDPSYHAYLARLAGENARRSEALRTGQPIYGPEQYGEREYLEYLMSNGVIALKEQLPGLAGSELELRHEYEAVKTSMFDRGRQIRVEVAQREYPAGARDHDQAKQAARAAMAAVAARVRRGDTLAAAVQHVAGVVLTETAFGDAPDRAIAVGPRDVVRQAARSLGLYAYSDVLDSGQSLVVVHCIAVESLGYLSFEDTRRYLQHRHIERAFEARVQDLIERAAVKLDRRVYERVAVK